MVHIFSESPSLITQFVAQLRDVQVQKDRMRFRRNVERIGEIMAYELSRRLPWKTENVVTPLGISGMPVLSERPVLATVLRAGLPLHQGLLNYFDEADNAFISAYRCYSSENDFEIRVEYLASPPLHERVLILADPMLATGQSLRLTYEALLSKGKPKSVHIVSLIASRQGLDYIRQHIPEAEIWIAALDEELNEHAYIVPGLGDAGDLAFGEK